MEFYKASLGFSFGKRCFNSQRDGILLVLGIFLAISKMFQFPTGWNSTLICNILAFIDTVSIPNGMEFYFDISGARRLENFVSIPNGMEFYLPL